MQDSVLSHVCIQLYLKWLANFFTIFTWQPQAIFQQEILICYGKQVVYFGVLE